MLGELTAYEGLIRGIKLQAELDEADRVRLSILDHIDGPLKACETALRTIGKRLETLPRHVVFGKITALARSALRASKSVLELSLDADQRSAASTHVPIWEVSKSYQLHRTIMKSAKTYVRDIQDNLQILRLSNEEPLSNLTKDVSKLREATAVEEAERHRVADQRSLEERFT